MITPQPSCSTAQEPWSSPQPTPVLPTATDVTPACSLPSTAEDLLCSDGISSRNAPKIRNHLRMSMAVLKLNTEEKVDGGKLSAGQRHCQDQLQRQSTGRVKQLGLSMDLGKRYRRKRLQLRRVDYLSKEELVLRFLKRPDKNGTVTTRQGEVPKIHSALLPLHLPSKVASRDTGQ